MQAARMPSNPVRETVGPSFGTLIRAYRMRWGWCARIGGFLRISGDGPFRIELAPADGVPPGARGPRTDETQYRIWWEKDKSGAKLLAEFPAVRNVRRVKRYLSFWVNDEGRVI